MLLAITIKEENPNLNAKKEFVKKLLENESLTEELYDDIICKILSKDTSSEYLNAGKALYNDIMLEISKYEIDENSSLENLLSILKLFDTDNIRDKKEDSIDIRRFGDTSNLDYFYIYGRKI